MAEIKSAIFEIMEDKKMEGYIERMLEEETVKSIDGLGEVEA